MAKYNPRTANGAARRKLRALLAKEGRPCHICGRPIDYKAPQFVTDPRTGKRAYNPWYFTIDEIVPVSKWREGGYASPMAAALDYNNIAPAHFKCNSARGNKPLKSAQINAKKYGKIPVEKPQKHSRNWSV